MQPALRDLWRRAYILLNVLSDPKDKQTIIVPTITVAELLVHVQPEDHGRFMAELQSRFFLPPFDLRACSLAARLWQQHRGLPKEEQIARGTLKSDVMIIGSVPFRLPN